MVLTFKSSRVSWFMFCTVHYCIACIYLLSLCTVNVWQCVTVLVNMPEPLDECAYSSPSLVCSKLFVSVLTRFVIILMFCSSRRLLCYLYISCLPRVASIESLKRATPFRLDTLQRQDHNPPRSNKLKINKVSRLIISWYFCDRWNLE